MNKFYTYLQNNSGGGFDQNDAIARFVIIEASNEDHASVRAQDIGLYFDGVANGVDCPCCGDRWYDSPDEAEEPSIYGIPVRTYTHPGMCKFMENEVRIHYLDGRVASMDLPLRDEVEPW